MALQISISENSFCVLQKDMKVVERPKPMITDPVSPPNLSLSLYFQVRWGFSFRKLKHVMSLHWIWPFLSSF